MGIPSAKTRCSAYCRLLAAPLISDFALSIENASEPITLISDREERDLVFCTNQGRPIRPQNLYTAFERFLKRGNFPS